MLFGVACLLDCANCWSSSPVRIAEISMSITDGSLSKDGTAIAVFPFSNSVGFNPLQRKGVATTAKFRWQFS